MTVDGIFYAGEKLVSYLFLDRDMVRISAQKLRVFFCGKNSFAIKEMTLNICKTILFRDKRDCLCILFSKPLFLSLLDVMLLVVVLLI